MTKQIADRKRYIPFALAANIVGIPGSRLRNWLMRDKIYLDADELRPNTAVHRRFSRLDVLRLGLITLLVDLGYKPKLASQLVEDGIYCAFWKRNQPELYPNSEDDSESYRASVVLNTPESEIIKRLENIALTLSPGGESDGPPFWTSSEKPESVVKIVIDIGLMIKKQHARFRAAEHEFTAELAGVFAE